MPKIWASHSPIRPYDSLFGHKKKTHEYCNVSKKFFLRVTDP